jgi:transposase-like protein
VKHNSSPFKWRHFEPTIILLCVRWYCRYQLSYRDVAETMKERGLDVDHSTVFRWVQRYAPEINKRVRQHLKMSGTSYRVDETYIKVGKHVSTSIARLIKRVRQSNLCSALGATFPRQNGSSRS